MPERREPGVIALCVVDRPAGSFGNMRPGDMWRWPDQDRDGRECWVVMLPERHCWYSTMQATGGGGWEVTGTPPNITVTPSIWCNPPEGWHGWIRDGELVPA